jgi:DNA-binding transcriptional ArsR family regulator
MATTKRDKQCRRETLRPHPTRDQVLDVMRAYGKPISPTQIARITGVSLGSTAYHVRTLVAAGFLELADEGRIRGAVEHFYALVADDEDPQIVDPVKQLMGLCGALIVPAADDGYPRPAMLDDRGREDLEQVLAQLRPTVKAIVLAATARGAG